MASRSQQEACLHLLTEPWLVLPAWLVQVCGIAGVGTARQAHQLLYCNHSIRSQEVHAGLEAGAFVAFIQTEAHRGQVDLGSDSTLCCCRSKPSKAGKLSPTGKSEQEAGKPLKQTLFWHAVSHKSDQGPHHAFCCCRSKHGTAQKPSPMSKSEQEMAKTLKQMPFWQSLRL